MQGLYGTFLSTSERIVEDFFLTLGHVINDQHLMFMLSVLNKNAFIRTLMFFSTCQSCHVTPSCPGRWKQRLFTYLFGTFKSATRATFIFILSGRCVPMVFILSSPEHNYGEVMFRWKSHLLLHTILLIYLIFSFGHKIKNMYVYGVVHL